MTNSLIGKVISTVWLAKDKKAIRFDVQGGKSIIALTEGDCCSSTWIESIDGAEQLIGTVVSVEDIPMPVLDHTKFFFGLLKFYGCKITTDKGYAVIDYRNESNGYYGGNLSWPEDSYYAGVYGQNISKGEWEQIA